MSCHSEAGGKLKINIQIKKLVVRLYVCMSFITDSILHFPISPTVQYDMTGNINKQYILLLE